MSDHDVLNALLRQDFYAFYRKCFHTIIPGTPFIANWHVKAIAHCLIEVQRGDITRLVVNLPPRSGKSICVSVAYLAWLLGHEVVSSVIAGATSPEQVKTNAAAGDWQLSPEEVKEVSSGRAPITAAICVRARSSSIRVRRAEPYRR